MSSRPKPMSSSPNTTLYIRLPNWVGDVCMSLPSLDAVLATGLPVVVCARPWARDLLADYPLHDFIDMRSSGWRDNARAVRQALPSTVIAHRRLGLLLPNSLSSALTFRCAGIACAGYRGEGRSLLLRWPVRKPAQDLHTVQSWYSLSRQTLTAWRLPVPDDTPPRQLGLRLHAQHRAQAQAAIAAQGLAPSGFVLIAPTATGLHHGNVKVWPNFDALTRSLQADGHVVLMCPPPAEQEAARANAPTALCLPPLNLGAFAALTAMTALVICNDSGVSHLAAAVQARQLTLIGVTDAAHTGPWSPHAVCLGENGRWPELNVVLERARTLLTDPMPARR